MWFKGKWIRCVLSGCIILGLMFAVIGPTYASAPEGASVSESVEASSETLQSIEMAFPTSEATLFPELQEKDSRHWPEAVLDEASVVTPSEAVQTAADPDVDMDVAGTASSDLETENEGQEQEPTKVTQADIRHMVSAVAENRLKAFESVAPTIGTDGGDWTIMALARAGLIDDALARQYMEAAASKMIEKSGVLDRNKYSEYSRLILGLTSVGADVTDVGGYDLLTYLTDYQKITKQGLNGPIWALIALDCHDYELPDMGEAVSAENKNSRRRMVETILDAQKEDGGWNLSSSVTGSDPDMTGMAMVALAPYAEENLESDIDAALAMKVQTALNAGLNCLSGMQKSTGDFASYGATNSESTVWALMSMTALSVDPLTDTRFIQNDTTVLDAIASYYTQDPTYGAGFKHVLSGEWNDMATDQSFYGLVSYLRMVDGKTAFFDMTDVVIGDEPEPTPEPTPDPTPEPTPEKKEEAATEETLEAAGGKVASATSAKKTTVAQQKTYLEASGLTIGTSDVQMVSTERAKALGTVLNTKGSGIAWVLSNIREHWLVFGISGVALVSAVIVAIILVKEKKNQK